MTPRLNTHGAVRLAWSLWVACLVLLALALILDFLRTDDILSYPWQIRSNDRTLYPIYAVLTGVLSLVYPTIGALIVSRLPRNSVGWIFCGVGLLYQLHHFALAYSNYALAENLSLPWSEYAAWFSVWVGFAGLILAGVFLMLLSPTGIYYPVGGRLWRGRRCWEPRWQRLLTASIRDVWPPMVMLRTRSGSWGLSEAG